MSLATLHSAIIKHHSSTEVFKINSLPRELLPKIFKCLNVHDRKNVRLTCRLWNNVCNLKEIIECEKFVFHFGKEGCDLPDLGAHIEECKALRSCLEFQGLPLYQLTSTLWANCGDRVQSLFIHECEVDDATISNIIVHCTNLKTLHLQSIVFEFNNPLPTTLPDPDGLFFTEGGIDELIKCNIERKNLTSLTFYPRDVDLLVSTNKLKKLFQIFPCIQTLVTGNFFLLKRDDGNLWVFDYCKERQWVFPPTMETFVSNLEDDILNFLKRSNSKLKKLSTHSDCTHHDYYDLFLNLCCKQKELEKLALYITTSNCPAEEDILFPILRGLPKLKELEFHIIRSSSKSFYSIEKLSEFFVLTSKLESMRLDVDDYSTEHLNPLPIFPSSPLTEYSTLKSLTISQMNLNFIYEILTRCRKSLYHLSVLPSVDDKILQLILEVHTELKTLHIGLVDPYKGNKDGSIPKEKKYPFRKLRNLKYLHIYHIGINVLRNNMSEFIFPKLKYFEFSCLSCIGYHVLNLPAVDAVVQNFHTMLEIVCKGAPYLETLKIHESIFKSIDLVNTFRNVQMKCLRYITICSLINPHENDFVKKSVSYFGCINAVFNACPSLYLINFAFNDHCTYSYNRHSKEVRRHSYAKTFDTILYKNMRSF